MSFFLLVITSLLIVAALVAATGIYVFILARNEELEERRRERLGVELSDEDKEALASLLREEAVDAMTKRLGSVGENLQLTLQQADSKQTVTELITQCVVLGLFVSILLAVYVAPQAIFAGFFIGYIPIALVKRKASSRARQLLVQLPDALELMGRAMQTGTGLGECFQLVSKEMKDPVANEFSRVYEVVRLGRDWREALMAMIDRNPSLFELRLFVSSLLLQREMGGNMVETVQKIGKMIRMRQVFDVKVKALTAEARASGNILAIMPVGVALMIGLFKPSYLAPLITYSLGQVAIVVCIVMYAVGLYLIRVVARVEV